MDIKLIPDRRQIMTFAMQQALAILQMPQLELAQWLAQEIERNPLLELDSPLSKFSLNMEIPAPLTLHEHLLNQIRENFSSDKERLIAEHLLNDLDERGFLSSCAVEESILSILQTFDPPGIFARNLQEALLIQLIAKGKKNSFAFDLVQNCFDDLLHGRYSVIKKKLKLTDLSAAIQILSQLTFRPAHAFKYEPAVLVIPDLLIEKIEKGWTLELYEGELPKFHIQTDYLTLEPELEEEKEILRHFKTQAKWIFRSLNRRKKLLREIGRILIRKQAQFLDQKGPLALITIKAIAEKLQVHESTISRALSGKYASTPRGIIPLRSLVSTSPATETTKETLERLIKAEDKRNPLTDDQLAKELKAKGIRVARRTIAKYRTQLKIASATKRKNRHTY